MPAVDFHLPFWFEGVTLLAKDHALAAREFLQAEDFEGTR